MLLQTRFKGAAGITTAGAVLVGLTAAVNPGSLPVTEGWKLAEPAFTLTDEKDKARQRKITKRWLDKNTRPLGTLKVQPDPPEMRKTNPGPPGTQKVNPGLPAVQGR
jgi:hypothetical protein